MTAWESSSWVDLMMMLTAVVLKLDKSILLWAFLIRDSYLLKNNHEIAHPSAVIGISSVFLKPGHLSWCKNMGLWRNLNASLLGHFSSKNALDHFSHFEKMKAWMQINDKKILIVSWSCLWSSGGNQCWSTYRNHRGCHELIPGLIKTELVLCKGKPPEKTSTLSLLNKTYTYFDITDITQNIFLFWWLKWFVNPVFQINTYSSPFLSVNSL